MHLYFCVSFSPSLFLCLFLSLSHRPDMTFVVDWALKKQLSVFSPSAVFHPPLPNSYGVCGCLCQCDLGIYLCSKVCWL